MDDNNTSEWVYSDNTDPDQDNTDVDKRIYLIEISEQTSQTNFEL